MRHTFRIFMIAAVGCLMARAAAAATDSPEQLTGETAVYTVVRGDTWTSIGARYGVYASTLAADNHVDLRQPLSVGQRLHIDNWHIVPAGMQPGTITVNVPQRMLFFTDGRGLSAYPIAVGRSTWQTPRASFSVVRKEENPTWHVPASILAESARLGRTQPPVVPPGPTNPLGRFWIGLSLPGFGIHGTPYESSVYQAATHGCMRLQHDDVADLFGRVEIGTRGRIIYAPILLAAAGGEVYLEVHGDIYRRLAKPPREVVRELAASAGLTDRVDWALAERVIQARSGVARSVTLAAD